mmetsp:Transcript_27619/g.41794  ORF Transcript_27619/g.41794 Transcript_27619/m.41794 type:complete len:317 (+) Transcript_27619:132-1082(+)
MYFLAVYSIPLFLFTVSLFPLLLRIGKDKREQEMIIIKNIDMPVVTGDETEESRTNWIGDAWILPFPLYSPSEIRSYFHLHNVLMIGDSEVSRIHYGTLIQLMYDATSHPSKYQLGNSTLLDRTYVADGSTCSKQIKSILSNHGSICRNFSEYDVGRIDFVQLECFHQVETFFHDHGYQLQQNYDIIMIGTGRLETAVPFQRRVCEEKRNDERTSMAFPYDAFHRMERLFQTLVNFQRNSTTPPLLLWRNGGFSREKQHRYVEEMDFRVKEQIRKKQMKIVLVDYANAIQERIYARLPLERALIFLQLTARSLLEN